jgi:hypothetical protein
MDGLFIWFERIQKHMLAGWMFTNNKNKDQLESNIKGGMMTQQSQSSAHMQKIYTL